LRKKKKKRSEESKVKREETKKKVEGKKNHEEVKKRSPNKHEECKKKENNTKRKSPRHAATKSEESYDTLESIETALEKYRTENPNVKEPNRFDLSQKTLNSLNGLNVMSNDTNFNNRFYLNTVPKADTIWAFRILFQLMN